MDHIGKAEGIRREEGTREAISESETLTRGHRVEQNSPDLMKLPGNIGGRITKTLLYGKKGDL